VCFGMKSTKEVSTTTNNTTNQSAATNEQKRQAIDPAITAASNANLAYLTNARDTGYQEYGGPRVAGVSEGEQGANAMLQGLVGTTNPFSSEVADTFRNASTAGPQSVSTTRAIDDVPGAGGGGSTQDYMNPYIAQVLAPQLREIERQRVASQKRLDTQSTMGGAFGDARSGFEGAENTRNYDLAGTDTTGRAYADAFAQAMGLKTADINRLLDVGKTNAGLAETALNRQSANAAQLQGLGAQDTQRQIDLTKQAAQSQGALGALTRGLSQQQLDALYQEFQNKQQYPLAVSNLLSTAIGKAQGNIDTTASGTNVGTSQATGLKTEDTKAPDNSGLQLLGALGGAFLRPAG
jgi:hypothetical protein